VCIASLDTFVHLFLLGENDSNCVVFESNCVCYESDCMAYESNCMTYESDCVSFESDCVACELDCRQSHCVDYELSYPSRTGLE
jgi:hypothetical protein